MRLVDEAGKPVRIDAAKLLFEDKDAKESLSGVGTDCLRINRTQAIGPGASSRLEATANTPGRGKIQLRPAR